MWHWYEKAAVLCGAFLKFWRLPWNRKHAAVMLVYTLDVKEAGMPMTPPEYWEALVTFDADDCGCVSLVPKHSAREAAGAWVIPPTVTNGSKTASTTPTFVTP